MNEKQFTRNLQSVGKTCFVQFFEHFSSETTPREDVVEILKSNTTYTEKSCRSRTSHAQSIIQAGMAIKALEIIINSRHYLISSKTKQKAKEILSLINT